ncbi:unnamed protein product [Pleuronectes platessa]|uniref:Uncharacterized protein n=1 Tax=Pleuronectes platessa TaxID=8262 RepID=A0A9N7VLJ9_PLEPL|nr:unnamed protein product [Pleuronectes platessa]
MMIQQQRNEEEVQLRSHGSGSLCPLSLDGLYIGNFLISFIPILTRTSPAEEKLYFNGTFPGLMMDE